MASSSYMPRRKTGEDLSNWSEQPQELTFSIMLRLDAFEILENAQKVCSAWRRVSKNPLLWRKIDIRSRRTVDSYYFGRMCRQAVDRSEGGLVEIKIGNFGGDSLVSYIADRSTNLRSLRLEYYYPITINGNEVYYPFSGLVNALAKLPLLEELEVSLTWTSKLNLKAIGHSCPKLKILKLNGSGSNSIRQRHDDDDAFEIAQSMPELRQLQLIGNKLTDAGLTAILDNCPHLEHLDLRKCLNIKFSGDLEKRCLESVKEFIPPKDSTAGCPFHGVLSNTDSEEEESEGDDDLVDSSEEESEGDDDLADNDDDLVDSSEEESEDDDCSIDSDE
ncbi:unnamed protein product [Arabis nemorensis]|uniref:F-box domain-containing protein n=1 Tax=Arabis nemorensis TaxID=586526 RepID=A0A565C2L4_9BRAS|nr:unnamed protein product [Arabis nemorensis]